MKLRKHVLLANLLKKEGEPDTCVDLENAEDALCSCYILFWYSRERAFWSRTCDDHGEFDEPAVTKVSAKTGWTLATTLSA